MKKEDVYSLIEYDGTYNEKVKKNLKKLLKKFHPDNYGNDKIIKIIYEVKKELETGNVTYKNKNVPFVDKELSSAEQHKYLNKLNKLYEEKEIKDVELRKLYKEMTNSFHNYSNQYDAYCQLNNEICHYEDNLLLSKKITKLDIIIYILLLFIIIIYLLFSTFWLLIILVVFIGILFYINYLKYKKYKAIKILIDGIYKKRKDFNNDISNLRKKIDDLSLSAYNLELELNHINNDIRYYEKLLKK